MNTVVLFIVWASVFVDALKFSLKDNGKPSHWNNKLTDIVDICGLIEQQTESPQKLVFNEYWWNLTICTNWQNIFKYIFSNKFNYTEVKAVFPFLHNMSD